MRNAVGMIESVLVLGGTSDIGRAIAARLVAQCGARKVILAQRQLDPDPEIQIGGAEVFHARFDALDVASHQDLIDQVSVGHGDIDVAVLAFGTLGDQALAEKDVGSAIQTVLTNYVGSVSVLTALGRLIESQGHGSIVVLSSVAGERGRRANYVYGSSKAGLDVFAQGLGDRLHAAGGHVLIVRPGFVKTRMTRGMAPAPFATTPDVVAGQVVKGLEEHAAVVYAPPLVRVVMAILKALPRAVFRRLEP